MLQKFGNIKLTFPTYQWLIDKIVMHTLLRLSWIGGIVGETQSVLLSESKIE